MSQKAVRVAVKPELLVWARESAGLDFDVLARSVSVKPEVIAAWERGEQQPTIRQLEKLANKVKRPLAALFLPAPPKEPNPPQDFRLLPETKAGKYAPETLLAFREARNIQRDAVALAELLGEPLRPDVPHCSLEEDPERFAGSVRRQFGITVEQQLRWREPYAARTAWRSALEDRGILVLQFSMPREDARGFALDSERVPIIAVTSRDAVEARIFSLFHEFCHLSLRISSVSGPPDPYLDKRLKSEKAAVEVFCNRFAGAFLVPYDDPATQSRLNSLVAAGSLDTASVVDVARALKVSKDVVLLRLLRRKLISQSVYQQTISRWRAEAAQAPPPPKQKGGADFVSTRVAQCGWLFSALVVRALDRGEISELTASRHLGVYPKHLDAVRDKLTRGGVDE